MLRLSMETREAYGLLLLRQKESALWMPDSWWVAMSEILPTEGMAPLPEGRVEKCFVGSGECLIPAAFSTSDGSGGVCFVCPHHSEVFEAWEEIFSQLPQEKMNALEREIEKYEKERP